MALKKLLAKNDDANPEMVLPFVFLTLVIGMIFTGMGIVATATGEDQIILVIIFGIAAASWIALAILAHKYSRITM